MRKKPLLDHRRETYDRAMQVFIDRVVGKRSNTCDRLDKSREHVEIRLEKLRQIR
jgi:hypothetical protein